MSLAALSKALSRALDIAPLCPPKAGAWDVHLRWVKLLEEEMFRQGDQERAHGLPVSPLMDRSSGKGISKSQKGVSEGRAGRGGPVGLRCHELVSERLSLYLSDAGRSC